MCKHEAGKEEVDEIREWEGPARKSRPGRGLESAQSSCDRCGVLGRAPVGMTFEQKPAVMLGEAAGKGEGAVSVDAWKWSWEGVQGALGRPVWWQPRGDKMGWGTEGLVNHVENFGYHLKNDGKLSTGFALGMTRSGSCFERVFLLVEGVGGWPQEWPRVERRRLTYYVCLSTSDRAFLPGF